MNSMGLRSRLGTHTPLADPLWGMEPFWKGAKPAGPMDVMVPWDVAEVGPSREHKLSPGSIQGGKGDNDSVPASALNS